MSARPSEWPLVGTVGRGRVVHVIQFGSARTRCGISVHLPDTACASIAPVDRPLVETVSCYRCIGPRQRIAMLDALIATPRGSAAEGRTPGQEDA